jgi:L-alanine-DL-glutamate epimerase-like enolase superfamily enzyme
MIGRIETIAAAIPLTPTKPRQMWTREWSTQLFVRVHAGGLRGLGQVMLGAGNSRGPYVAMVERLGKALKGMEETDIEGLWNLMRRITYSGGYGVTTGAISGVEMALWDIKGRKRSLPVSRLLGGNPREMKRYASLSRYSKKEQVVKVVESLLGRGYEFIKLHQSKDDTLEVVRDVRRKCGKGFSLAVDLNCGMNFAAAEGFLRQIGPYDLEWVEEPLWPPDDFDALKRLNSVGPVAAGENYFSYYDFERLMKMKALSFYQPDIAKVGGFTAIRAILDIAKRFGVRVAFHSRPDNGWVGTTASAHAASGCGVDALLETPPNDPPSIFRFEGKVTKTDILANGAGLGIELGEPIPVSKDGPILHFSNT